LSSTSIKAPRLLTRSIRCTPSIICRTGRTIATTAGASFAARGYASATSAARLGLSARDCTDEADSSGGNPQVAAQVPEARSLLIQGPEPKQQGDMQFHPHGAKAARSAVPEVHLGRCRVAVLDAELAFYVWLGVVRACWAQLSTLAYTEYVPDHDCFGRCRQPT
jgi:hypothetical protein